MRKILLLIVWITLTIWLATFSYAYLLNVSNAPEHWNVQKVIVPQWKSIVFSLSKTIESINFNKDSGFTIRTLEWSQWIDMSDQAEDYTPMKWYIIRNVQEWNLEIDITFKNITNVGDLILTKTLKAWWNQKRFRDRGIRWFQRNDGIWLNSNAK